MTAGRSDSTIRVVKDYWLYERPQFDLGNPVSNVESAQEGGSPIAQLNLTREEMVNAARDNFANEDMLQRLAAVFPTWRLLAEGQPVSPEQVAIAVDRPVDEVSNDLRRAEDIGFFGYDDDGNVVNFFGLHLSPTRHRLKIAEQELFAG